VVRNSRRERPGYLVFNVKFSSYYRIRNPLYANTVALPIEVRIR
jgi:hypothetical protein